MTGKKKSLFVSGLAILAAGTAITLSSLSTKETTDDSKRDGQILSVQPSGTERGIIRVSNVYELQNAIRTAADYDTIIVTTNGSPYNLSELPCMNTNGYLYVTNSITIRGESNNPLDVQIFGAEYVSRSTNRLFFVKAPYCRFENISLFSGNCSTNYSYEPYVGGINRGGAIYLALATNECTISNCFFDENYAERGGAIACSRKDDMTTIIEDCSFESNHANNAGGAIYNGGIIRRCQFKYNVSLNVGGAVCYGTLLDCNENGGNIGVKGSELYGCTAIAYKYANSVFPDNKSSRFHDCLFDRCRFHVTNGVLFSGWYEVRSSTITDGTNFALSVAFPGGWDYEHTNDEGHATWRPSRIVNCTIANNQDYSLLSSGRIGDECLEIYNTIFTDNSTWINKGKVNLNLATNGYYKTIDMTYAQRYFALGWDGYLSSESITVGDDGGDTIQVDPELLTATWNSFSAYSEVSGDSEYVTVSYAQYYYAHGWNGDPYVGSFVSKSAYATISPDSKTRLPLIMRLWTTDKTWYDYYMEQEYGGMTWDGESEYIFHSFVECAFSRSISNVFTKATQTAPAGICSSFFTIPYIEEEEEWDLHQDWIYRCYISHLNFYFVSDINNPYAITTSSPAYHLHLDTYGIEETIYLDWMQNALDLRGVPRLSGPYSSSLDVGAYQAITQ